MKSEISEPRIWPMLYKTIRLASFYPRLNILYLQFSDRYLPRLTLHRTELEVKESYIWLLLVEIAKWTIFSSDIFHLHLFIFIQILTTLNLSSNQIGHHGAELLADTLRHNKVSFTLSASLSFPSSFIPTGNYYTRSR
jgi:hypothetical protein